MVSSATDQPTKANDSTAGERSDYLLGGIYNAGHRFNMSRADIEAALVRNLGWTPLKAHTLVGLWMTTLPYRTPAAPLTPLGPVSNADEAK